MKFIIKAIMIIAVVFGIVGLIIGLELFWRPPDPLRHCQKVLIAAFDIWQVENHTNVYPNVEGHGLLSFAKFGDSQKLADYTNDYAYIPGLKANDPKDLVALYLKQKTRRTWNGDRHYNRHTEKMWMVFGPDLFEPAHGHFLSEGGTRETTAEFKRRLQKTFDFLKENNRLYWENVVKEHTEFMNSIGDD